MRYLREILSMLAFFVFMSVGGILIFWGMCTWTTSFEEPTRKELFYATLALVVGVAVMFLGGRWFGNF